MNYPLYFDSKNSFNLFEMEDYLKEAHSTPDLENFIIPSLV